MSLKYLSRNQYAGRTKVVAISFITIMLCSICIPILSTPTKFDSYGSHTIEIIDVSRLSDSQISINSDSDFILGGYPGSGIAGDPYIIANQFIDLDAQNLSDSLVFDITNDIGFTEGRHVVLIGVYYLDQLIFRFRDDPFEMYSTAFLVSYRRIRDVEVLPTDRIRPGGHVNFAVLKIDGIEREIDDQEVGEIEEKLRDVAEEYAMSYTWSEITEISEFIRMMDSKGIAVSRVHERNDKHTCFGKFKKDLPGLESIIDKMICIPVGWWISTEERGYIIDSIKEGWM